MINLMNKYFIYVLLQKIHRCLYSAGFLNARKLRHFIIKVGHIAGSLPSVPFRVTLLLRLFDPSFILTYSYILPFNMRLLRKVFNIFSFR